MKNIKKTLVLLVSPSGGGKSTVAEIMCANGYMETISHTTRIKRTGEKDQHEVKIGERNSYFFVTNSEFNDLVASGEMLEHVIFGGNQYGVHSGQIIDHDKVILVCEPEGVKQIQLWAQNQEEDYNVVVCYLDISKELQVERMLSRGDSMDSIEARMAADDIRERVLELEVDLTFNVKSYSANDIADIIMYSVQKGL